MHLSIGAVTAMTARSDRLVVYENGVGAINLPQNESQIGVDNSRGVHPVSLSRMSEFLSLVNGRLFDLINPFEFQTKGEMCRIFLKTDNSDVVSKTISCDHFPIHVAGKSQCGICTSCLLRRMALYSAGLAGSDPSCKYKDDFKHSKPDKPEKLFDLQDMLAQAEKIHACVNSASPWARLSAEFPELLETHLVQAKHLGTDRSKIASKLVRMYKTYAEEWRNIPIAELDSN